MANLLFGEMRSMSSRCTATGRTFHLTTHNGTGVCPLPVTHFNASLTSTQRNRPPEHAPERRVMTAAPGEVYCPEKTERRLCTIGGITVGKVLINATSTSKT